jgi:hypothetical protein
VTARRGLAALNPAWSQGDVEAKAEALIELDIEAASGVLLDNGGLDGGLADVAVAVGLGSRPGLIRGGSCAGRLTFRRSGPAFESLSGRTG